MNNGLKELFDALAQDESLGKKFEECKTPEDAYNVAKEIADGYTLEEFKNVMAEISKQKESGRELSEEDLDSVSGGSGAELGIKIGVAVGGAAVTIGGAAMGASAASM